jgi:hypothetical protein
VPLKNDNLRVSEDPYQVKPASKTVITGSQAFGDSVNDRTPGGRVSLGATAAAKENMATSFEEPRATSFDGDLSMIEQRIIDLNNQFKVQIEEEAEIELQMIDEIQWLNEIAF